MHWFKHMQDASEQETESRILAKLGHRGYAVHWLIYEAVAKEVDWKGRCQRTCPVRAWVRRTRTARPTFLAFCDFAVTLPDYGISFQRAVDESQSEVQLGLDTRETFLQLEPDDLVTIRIPKLSELLDEYTRKRRPVSGQRPDSVAPDQKRKRIEKEPDETGEEMAPRYRRDLTGQVKRMLRGSAKRTGGLEPIGSVLGGLGKPTSGNRQRDARTNGVGTGEDE